jgi:menaquinone-specific isochorismate synthase
VSPPLADRTGPDPAPARPPVERAGASVGKLVARTRRLDVDVDLVAVAGARGVLFEQGRHGFAGRGRAPVSVVVPRPASPAEAAAAVHHVLGAIVVDDQVGRPGCGPVALGALPFAPDVAGELVVPEVVVGRAEDGTRWITTIAPAGSGEDQHDELVDALLDACADPATPAPSALATDFRVTSVRPPADWCDALATARDDLRDGAADKVVLAREVVVDATRPIDRTVVLQRLRAAYPACMLYAVDGFVGATPELLVARTGDLVRSHPMAGTAPRSNDPTTDARLAAALLSSAKDREEHRITIDMVHDTLLPWCSYLDEEAEPSVVAMANVQHLATLVEGRLSSPPASVVELLTALHPTPAVCGSPRPAALALIDRYEQLDRGRYAGPVGWVDAAGNGEWAVGLRCAELDGTRARLFAGVGVVADSDPELELAETQAKLQALLSVLLRP